MNASELKMYNLGRQARQADHPIEACNLSQFDPLRVWWVAGFHDEDVEARVKAQRVYDKEEGECNTK